MALDLSKSDTNNLAFNRVRLLTVISRQEPAVFEKPKKFKVYKV